MLDEVGASLAVIANTGDDTEAYGAHVSPDPDLVTYWLADLIDERGYGIAGDTWKVMDAMEAAGQETWFRLGDRDLAMCLIRTRLMAEGHSATAAHAAVVDALGVPARVLPASDEPVRTHVTALGRDWAFQEFMIVNRAQGPIEGVEFHGVEHARPTDQVLQALRDAEAIVIGPSNPIASIAPILAVPAMRDALRSAPAPVVAVSPFVGGEVLKGPTRDFCEYAGIEPTAAGMAEAYDGLLDGIVADEPVEGLPALRTDTQMDTPRARARVASETLEFARALAS
jgi:LPPG:FO 2-phospho-L-lactate transferase